MKAAARWLWGICRTFWWVLILIAVTVLGVGFIRRRDKKAQKAIEEVATEETTSLVQVATQKIQSAVTDIKIEQAIIKTETAKERKKLEEIRKEPDEKKRRKKLSSRLKARI
jgi:hypothetical protein